MLSSLNQHLALEHYRFHVIEQWPDGPRKTAGLFAARSAFDSLSHTLSSDAVNDASFVCTACSRKNILFSAQRRLNAENPAADENATIPNPPMP